MDVILTHLHPDFDALASMVAVHLLHPEARPLVPPASWAPVARFLALHGEALGMGALADLEPARVKKAYVVDMHDPARLGPASCLLDRDVVWEIYDHHPRVPGGLEGPGEIRPTGACTTLLVERLRGAIPPLEATLLALGIYEDTGDLTFPGTTPEDVRAVARLLEEGADLDRVHRWRRMGNDLGPDQQALLRQALDTTEIRGVGGLRVAIAGVAHRRFVEVAPVVDRLLAALDADLAALAFEQDGCTWLVARSRRQGVELHEWLAPFSPKGHPGAVSAKVPGMSFAETTETLRERLTFLPGEPTAEAVMGAPLRAVTPGTSVEDALEACARWEVGTLAVIQGDRVLGLVLRRDLEKARRHGLAGTVVRAYLSPARDVAASTPLSELEQALVRPPGRVLVFREGTPVGLVSARDLVRRRALPVSHPDLRESLRARWPEPAYALLQRVAGMVRQPMYLVGGAVRDLLLDRANLDLDLVVEGDAVAVARELAGSLNGSLSTHGQLGTARITLEGGLHLDLATARVETYARPGALPRVAPASIAEDLRRRDFTVNALALRLDGEHFGELLDAFGGLQDLRAGELRVLHPVSFLDDPTRLWRGVRFEHQLGMRLDPHTELLAREAMATGRFDGVGGERVRQELVRLLGGRGLVRRVRRLCALGAWRILDPRIAPGAAELLALRRLERFHAMAAALGDGLPAPSGGQWPIALAIVLGTLDASNDELEGILNRLHVARKDRAPLLRCLEARPLLHAGERSLRQLKSAGIEAAWYLACMTPSRALRRRIREVVESPAPTAADLGVDGEWLRAEGLAPGPAFREIIAGVEEAIHDGLVGTPDDAQELARHLMQAHLRHGTGSGPQV